MAAQRHYSTMIVIVIPGWRVHKRWKVPATEKGPMVTFVPANCRLLTAGAPGSGSILGVPFCQVPLKRLWTMDVSLTRRSLDPLEIVTDGWRKPAALTWTVGTPFV